MRNSNQHSVLGHLTPLYLVVLIGAVTILGAVPTEAQGQSDWNPRELGGIWRTSIRDITLGMLPGEEIVFTPYGAEQHKSFDLQDYSRKGCEIKGATRQLLSNSLSMFVQDPILEMMVILHEDHNRFRAVYMDGRDHPEEVYLIPEPFGHSVGHWEGDTLVVDSVGFRDTTYLDTNGLGHSVRLHLTERYERTGPDTLEWTTTVEDELFFEKPFTFRSVFTRQTGLRLMMYDCQNERDIEHLESIVRGDNETHRNPEVFVFPD